LPYPYGGIQIAFKAARIVAVDMKSSIAFIVATLALCSIALPAHAIAPKQDQQQARKQMSDGKVLSLRQIEALILPKMRGMEYLGPEYDEDSKIYRLKFVDNGRVIFVDVDARSGSIVRQR
jgi:uncharacterized membrane protein YkoI